MKFLLLIAICIVIATSASEIDDLNRSSSKPHRQPKSILCNPFFNSIFGGSLCNMYCYNQRYLQAGLIYKSAYCLDSQCFCVA